MHRADGLILALALQMLQIVVHPVDDARCVVHKLRSGLGALLLGSGICTLTFFLCFDLISERAPVPPLPLSTGQLAVAILVKSLL